MESAPSMYMTVHVHTDGACLFYMYMHVYISVCTCIILHTITYVYTCTSTCSRCPILALGISLSDIL